MSAPTPPRDEADPPPDQGPSAFTDAQVSRGARWAFGGLVVSQLLRLCGNLLLWRLLFPEAFGMMALISAFLQGVHMFSDVGIGPSIVQGERGDDPDFLNTAWTIQVVRGFVLAGAAALLAPVVADFYGEPELATLIPIAGLGAIFDGWTSTRVFTQSRHISLARLTLLRLVTQAAGLLFMVVYAYVERSVLGLVLGSLLSSCLDTIASHTLLPGIKNRFRLQRDDVRRLVRFGRWIFLSTVLSFLVMQSDRLVLGKLIPLSLLGVYGIALAWSSIAGMVTERVFDNVLFPLLSRLHNSGGDFSKPYRRARLPWVMLAGWILACLVGGGGALIRFLYDARASEAEWMLRYLAIGAWFGTLGSSASAATLARGKASGLALGSAVKLVGMVGLVVLGMKLWGFPGALAGLVLSELLRYATLSAFVARLGSRALLDDAWLSAVVAVAAAGGFATARAVAAGLGAIFSARIAALFEGGLVLVVVTVPWLVVYLLVRRTLAEQPE